MPPVPLADLAADPSDPDALAACRLEIRRLLGADPVLASEVRAMLATEASVTQRVQANRDAYTAGRDLTVINNSVTSSQGELQGLMPAEQTAAASVAVGDIPQEPPGFRSRPELAALCDMTGRQVPVVSAVIGMRGVGKTQLAAAYAREKLASRWRLVAWVNAEDPGALAAGLAAVADAAGLAGARRGADAGRVIRHWLEGDGDRCLVVFDNATDVDALRPFIPAGGAARVLITSSQRSMANLGTSIGVESFSPDEAVAFLTGRTGLPAGEGAAAVAAEVGYLPVALAQAAAVIAGQRITFRTYLDRLRSMPVQDYLAREQGQPYPHGVAEAILLALDAAQAGEQGGVRAGVMEVLAVLSPAGVRRDLLHAAGHSGALGGSGTTDAVVVDAALAQLAERSLLTFSMDGQAVIVHRLIMRVLRDRLDGEGRLALVCQAAAGVLTARAEAVEGSGERASIRDTADQMMALCTSARAGHGLGVLLLRLQYRLLSLLIVLGDTAAQAVQVGESLTADLERMLGPDHPRTLDAQDLLGVAYEDAARLGEAIAVLERTWDSRKRLLGPSHLDTLASCNNLATVYQEAGRAADAIPLHQLGAAAIARQLGTAHPDALTAQNNLAVAYRMAGRPDEAITLHQAVLAGRERILAPDHPDTLTTRHDLADAHRAAGQLDEAVTLYRSVLADREQVLGPDHPSTLITRNNLAISYQETGRTAEAIQLHEQTLAARERVLGPTHPHTITSRAELAETRRTSGQSQNSPSAGSLNQDSAGE